MYARNDVLKLKGIAFHCLPEMRQWMPQAFQILGHLVVFTHPFQHASNIKLHSILYQDQIHKVRIFILVSSLLTFSFISYNEQGMECQQTLMES